MRTLITTCALAALMTMSVVGYAQTANAPKGEVTTASKGMMMNCPMMTGMPGMQKEMGGMMSDMQAMMKDAKDPALRARMQKMQERMTAMMASMQTMGMMGGQQSGNTAPKTESAPSKETPPATAPASPEDHAAHHPAE